MNCDNCKHLRQYTLGPDECGAGSTVWCCAKFHWENDPMVDPIEEGEDPWKDCPDKIIKEVEKCISCGKPIEDHLDEYGSYIPCLEQIGETIAYHESEDDG